VDAQAAALLADSDGEDIPARPFRDRYRTPASIRQYKAASTPAATIIQKTWVSTVPNLASLALS